MSVLTIGSENPDFSFVLQKNPHTITESKKPYTKSIRQGNAYGWYTSDQANQFRLWFKDAPNASSFAEGNRAEFEYLDRTRYAHPYLPIALITNCLASAFKERDEKDVDYPCFLETTVEVRKGKLMEQLHLHFQDIATIQYEHLSGHAYIITIKALNVHTLLNVAMVVFLMFCLGTKDLYVNLKGDVVEKYIKAINRVNAPYFIRYLFKRNVFSNKNTFEKNKALLDTDTIFLTHGDTLRQRLDAILPILEGGEVLHDIGCGEELNYVTRLCGRYETVFACDADPEIQDNIVGKLKGRQIENVVSMGEITAESVDENSSLYDGADILVTEVFEHMEKGKATKLLNALLKTDFNQLVITVPNKDFNKFYLLADDQSRHDDHKWEPTLAEFYCWVSEAFERERGLKLMVKGIGDTVEDIPTSLMAVFTRNKD